MSDVWAWIVIDFVSVSIVICCSCFSLIDTHCLVKKNQPGLFSFSLLPFLFTTKRHVWCLSLNRHWFCYHFNNSVFSLSVASCSVEKRRPGLASFQSLCCLFFFFDPTTVVMKILICIFAGHQQLFDDHNCTINAFVSILIVCVFLIDAACMVKKSRPGPFSVSLLAFSYALFGVHMCSWLTESFFFFFFFLFSDHLTVVMEILICIFYRQLFDDHKCTTSSQGARVFGVLLIASETCNCRWKQGQITM